MRALLVGDPHVTAEELPDCEILLEDILSCVRSRDDIDAVVFLGDQHHNHSLLHVDVVAYWLRAFSLLKKEVHVMALVGNHDLPGDSSSSSHALQPYEALGVAIVDHPLISGNVLFLPYFRTAEEFEAALEAHRQPVVVCHQTFTGSRYDNGFYAQDGLDPHRWPDRVFISGHIHTPQRFANVTYVGAPRWRTLADANQDRCLSIWDLEVGKLLELIPTRCQRILALEDREDRPATRPQLEGARLYVDIHGSPNWCKERIPYWQDARIRTFPASTTGTPLSEAQGIGMAFRQYLRSQFEPPNGSSLAALEAALEARGAWS